jgi:hypothetical protein
MLLMDLSRLVCGSEQGRPAEPGGAGGVFGGEAGQEELSRSSTPASSSTAASPISRDRFRGRHAGDPQFVLRELQLVPTRRFAQRNRGRRGLDILQRIQKMAALDVRCRRDFPQCAKWT